MSLRAALLALAGAAGATAAAPEATLCDGAIARAVLAHLAAVGAWPWPTPTRTPPAAAAIGSTPPPLPWAAGLRLVAEATWRGSPELPRTALVPLEPRPGKPLGVFPGPGPAGAVLLASGQGALDGIRDGSLARAELPTPLFATLTGGRPQSPPGLSSGPAAPVRFGVWVPRTTPGPTLARWLRALESFEAHPAGDAVLVALGADRFRAARAGPEPPPRKRPSP